MKKLITILILFACVFYPTDCFAKKGKRHKIKSCKQKQEWFTKSPVNLENIFSIIPLGNLNPPEHTHPTRHMYFHLKREEGVHDRTIQTPIYAPGKLFITQITSNSVIGENGVTDFGLQFKSCKELNGYFLHITSLSKKLTTLFDKSDKDCNRYELDGNEYEYCRSSLKIKVKTGDELGIVGGLNMLAFDFGLFDSRIDEHQFVNQQRWENHSELIYNVCVLDYYSKDLKSDLESHLGYGEERRTIAPLCGKINHDLKNTAQGVWFHENSTDVFNETLNIALVPDNIHPGTSVFSIGTSLRDIGIESGAYYFNPDKSGMVNKDFSEVKDNGTTYCYETRKGFLGGQFNLDEPLSILLVKLEDDKLRVGKSLSSSCSESSLEFSNGFVEFSR